MALSTWPSTGPVDAWLLELGVDLSEVIGWAALYWDGSGSVNSAEIYSSVGTPWSTLVSDPELLPETSLQGYLVFIRRDRHLYTIWLDGYDTYYLIGKTDPVAGLLLSDAKWNQMQNRIRWAFDRRGHFATGYTDWENEVPT